MGRSTSIEQRSGASPMAVVAAAIGWLLLAVMTVGRMRDDLTTTLHRDEAIAWTYANLPLTEIPGALEFDVNPPVYFLALHTWLTGGGSGEVYLRGLSVVAMLVAAGVAFDAFAFDGHMWLIEGGHVVSFIDGPDAVTEVIAPKELALPKRGRVRALDLAGSAECEVDARGTVLYRMAYQVETCTAGRYVREAEDLLASARSGHLYREGDAVGTGRAFSYAVPEPKGRGLLVHAWHGFPADHTILRTQTLIERV